jgi:hypothetical protein
MNIESLWTAAEETILVEAVAAGLTNPQIAELLPGRSISAIRARRRRLGRGQGHTTPTTGRLPLLERIVALEQTIAAALVEVRQDWDYIDQLLQGLAYFRWKGGRQ